MELGFGIFLGLIFCSLIYLYVKTGNKILKWIGFSVVGLVIFIILLILYVQIKNYVSTLPSIVKELEGVELNETLSDIEFNLGKFEEAGTGYKSINNPRLFATMEDNRVIRISYFCSKDTYDSTKVNGISCGKSSQEILKLFGNNIEVLCNTEDNTLRIYKINKYGVGYLLRQNSVAGFIIKDVERMKNENLEYYPNCNK